MTDPRRVEAVLFASGRYLSVSELADLAGVDPGEVESSVGLLREQYSEIDSCLTIFEQDDRYKMNVVEDYSFVVRRVVSEAELGDALMETLALIAYKAPVLQSDIVDARSARAYNHIHRLCERGFVEREREGRTYKLHVTDKFYGYFDVQDRNELGQVFEAVQPPEVDVDLDEDIDSSDQERFENFLSDRLREVEERDKEEEEAFLDNLDQRLEEVREDVSSIDTEEEAVTVDAESESEEAELGSED